MNLERGGDVIIPQKDGRDIQIPKEDLDTSGSEEEDGANNNVNGDDFMMDNEKIAGEEGLIGTYKPEGDEGEAQPEEELAAAEEAAPPAKVKLLKDRAKSRDHLLTHQPPNPECEACVAAKMRDVQHFRGAFDRSPQEWGDLMTCDHIDSRASNTGLRGFQQALLCKDV